MLYLNSYNLVSPVSTINAGQRRKNSTIGAAADSFVRFGKNTDVGLEHPIFKQYGLTVAIATKKDLEDLAVIYKKMISDVSESSLDNAVSSLMNMPEEELKSHIRSELKEGDLPQGVTFDDVWPELKKMYGDKENVKQLLDNVAKLDGKEFPLKLVQSRFIENSKGDVVVLRDKNKRIVGMEGVNQFQNTHERQLMANDFESIDPKHALLSDLYVEPEYRNKGIGAALKETIIRHANKSLGYQYVWSPAAVDNSSHRTNMKMGYTPLTPSTQFKDSPAFTKEKNEALLKEYNVGSRQLAWLKISEMKPVDYKASK